MKRVMFCASLLALTSVNISADTESSEVFPLPDITIGMTWTTLIKKYPSIKVMMADEDDGDDQNLKDLIAIYEIHTNKFWDTLVISIEATKVESLSYFYANNELFSKKPNMRDYDKIIKNIKPLFWQLKKELGATFEKKVTHGERTKERCAMYVWKRENDVVAFSHSPVSKVKKGGLFDCQLVIAAKIENLAGLYERMATDSIPEDAKLWADAMDE